MAIKAMGCELKKILDNNYVPSDKEWEDLTDTEKINRLASLVAVQRKQIDELIEHTRCGYIPGYDVINVKPTKEFQIRFLGQY